jgi:hypothetical protein
LVKAAAQLGHILDRETQGRVSVNSFIGQYLSILKFPADVSDALVSGRLNLQEAAQLARLTPERLECSAQAAKDQRADLIRSHLAVQGSQTRLRTRVKELLGENGSETITAHNMAAVIARADELLEIDPQDTRHLFWEEMKRIFYAMRDVRLEDLDDETMEDFISVMDQVSNVLHKIDKKRRERERVNNRPVA